VIHYTIELTDCTNVLLAEIADDEMKRRDVALTYAMALVARETVGWHAVNKAIIERWSKSGLMWIKKQAWRIAGRKT